jgi:ubiquinol-cytochrome c reductase cytochrome b subunit
VPDKLAGVLAMGGAVVIWFFLPWLDRSKVRSIRYKGIFYKLFLSVFVVSFCVLGYLGMEVPTPGKTLLAQICSVIYFAFFLLMPIYTSLDKTQTVPKRVT